MVKCKYGVFAALIVFFLLFSFYPTIFELQNAGKLADHSREFILEHNYYWPDYNLYLSKIRQGMEGRWTAVEKYTTEKHKGSLIHEFYVILGQLGRLTSIDPNAAYLAGRILLASLLLIVIAIVCNFFFPSFPWAIIAFLTVAVSGSFPRFFSDANGLQVGRYMEWWSNIDSLQRITFIPHILFGQIISFYLLYRLTMKPFNKTQGKQLNNVTMKQLFFYSLLGNITGLVFPPSLITLNTTIFLLVLIRLIKGRNKESVRKIMLNVKCYMLYAVSTLPSLLYLFIITKSIPWSALVIFHQNHPMMVPFDQYMLGTGPVFFLGFLGAITAIIRREKKYLPLILFIVSTLLFASFFSLVKEQSPLRFTQTGLFIPMGILASYFFFQAFHLSDLGDLGYLSRKTIRTGVSLVICGYILFSLFIMTTSLNWQTTWISQRLKANIPAVPYPPQAMYPLKDWMDGIRWLRDNTNHGKIVLAAITAGNYIPAYSGNTVYFGQANTYDYERKDTQVTNFFKGSMSKTAAELFLKGEKISSIFYSIQEKDLSGGKKLEDIYPFLKSVYSNSIVTIYSY